MKRTRSPPKRASLIESRDEQRALPEAAMLLCVPWLAPGEGRQSEGTKKIAVKKLAGDI
jgi:hypothetical protein